MPKDDYASAALLERWITQYGDMLVRLAYGMLRDRMQLRIRCSRLGAAIIPSAANARKKPI